MYSKITQRSHSFLYNLASQLNEHGPSGLGPEEIQGAPPSERSFSEAAHLWLHNGILVAGGRLLFVIVTVPKGPG